MPAREIAEKIAENVILSRATLGVMYFRIPKTGTLKVVTLYRSQTGGIGGTWYFNIKQNGAGLWTGSNRLTFTLGVESAQKSGLSVAVTEGDIIQLDLEQVGSGSITGHLVLTLDILADDTQSIPAGGTTGQVLAKNSNTDYDTEWITGGGGASDLDDLTDVTITSPTSGQVLKYDGTVWKNDVDSVGKGTASTASSSTPTPNADTDEVYILTALAAGAVFGAPTGTPVDGQPLMIRIKDNGTARTLGWNAAYRAVGVTLPTTTVISKTLYVGCIYNVADSKWDVLGVSQEA